MIQAGADVNMRNKNGETLLKKAFQYNKNPEIATTLIQSGIDVNARDENGKTPLIWAAWFNEDSDVIIALIQAGADVNAQDKNGETALMNVFSEKVADTLLKYGADVNMKDKQGNTALIKHASSIIPIERLINLLHMRCVLYPLIPMSGGCWPNTRITNPHIVHLLLKHGANVNDRNHLGETALMKTEDMDILKLLLEYGADINLRDHHGATALMKIPYLENLQQSLQMMMCPVIITQAHIKRYLYTPDIYHPQKNELLIQHGADVNVQDNNGVTPLMWAAGWRQSYLIPSLLANGADIHLRDNQGKTVFDYIKDKTFVRQQAKNIKTNPYNCFPTENKKSWFNFKYDD